MTNDNSSEPGFSAKWEKMKEKLLFAFLRAIDTSTLEAAKGRNFEQEEIESVRAFLKKTGADTDIQSTEDILKEERNRSLARREEAATAAAYSLYQHLKKEESEGRTGNVVGIIPNDPPGSMTLIVKKPKDNGGPV